MMLLGKVADWPAEWRELFEERAAIIEFVGNFPRQDAELQAEIQVRSRAGNEEL